MVGRNDMNISRRTQNSFINVSVSILGQVISVVIGFSARIVFIRQLGDVYLGANTLFTNIVGLFSLAELGVGTAINYSLYKPLAEKNERKLKSLMQLYRKVYFIIGVVIFAIGIIVMPFLNLFMQTSDTTQVDSLHFIFFLFVLNSSVSYFYSFKRALIISDQKRYIATLYRYAFFILMNGIQIVFLYLTSDYIVFLFIMLACTIAENICVSKKANKMYPFLKDKDIDKIEDSDVSEIKRNTVALLYHKIGSTIVNSTDSILISKLIGLVTVAKYSNYYLITNTLNIIMAQFFMSLTASVGNLGASEANEKSERVFFRLFFLNFWIVCILSVCIYATADAFIQLCFGNNYVLNHFVLMCIVFNFFLYQIRRTVMCFKDALGIFWYDRYKSLVEAVINLISSIILGIKFGLEGIIIGTIISSIATSIWVEPYVLFKYAFKNTPKKYFIQLLLYVSITIALCPLCRWIVNYMQLGGLIGFALSVFFCVVVVSAFISVLFFKTDSFSYFLSLSKSVLFNLKNCIRK